jgi:hypothetical protein
MSLFRRTRIEASEETVPEVNAEIYALKAGSVVTAFFLLHELHDPKREIMSAHRKVWKKYFLIVMF